MKKLERIKLLIERLDEKEEVCRSCNGEMLKVWRVFNFSKSKIICYEICGSCCCNMYRVKDKYYINVKRYGFEENDFREVDRNGNEIG